MEIRDSKLLVLISAISYLVLFTILSLVIH
jgi:hypothetical protein